MNDTALSLVAVGLLLASSTTGALAADRLAVNHGSSMEPTLCDGSVLLVDRDATPDVGDIVSVRYTEGERPTVHRVIDTAPDYDLVDGETVRESGVDYITAGDDDDTVDFDEMWRAPGRGKTTDYADNEQILGVASSVLYDGCGPV